MKFYLTLCLMLITLFVSAEKINVTVIDYKSEMIGSQQRQSFISEFGDYVMQSGGYNYNSIKDDSLPNYWNNFDKIREKVGEDTDKTIIFKYYVFGDNFVIKMAVLNMNEDKVERIEEYSLFKPEELKTIAKKSSMMFVHNKSKKELEEVGLMVPTENTEELNKRSYSLVGLSLNTGYMWATVDGGYAGDYKKVLLLSAGLPMEVSKNDRLDLTFDLLVASSVCASIGFTHIHKPTKITPYWGGDAGIEYVFHRTAQYPSNSLGGIMLRPKFGYIIMNTNHASIYLETAYRFVTNDFFDQGIEFRFGFIVR